MISTTNPNRRIHRLSPRRDSSLLPLVGVVAAIAILILLFVPTARHPARVASLIAQQPPSKLPVPVAGVRPSTLANTWGAARSGGRRHEGIDIFARRNTPVRSTTEGVVISTAPNPLGGTCITVLGPGGHRHYYAHLERHGRYSTGDWVQRGDTIGYVGNSGNARTTPPHLHYGIYTASGAVNPFPLLNTGRRGGEGAGRRAGGEARRMKESLKRNAHKKKSQKKKTPQKKRSQQIAD